MCFPLGLASYVNAFVSQYYGAGRHDRIGLVVWQGVWIGLATVPLTAATIPLASSHVSTASATRRRSQPTKSEFYRTICLGIGGDGRLPRRCRPFSPAAGACAPVMVVDSSAALLNVVLTIGDLRQAGFARVGCQRSGLGHGDGPVVEGTCLSALFLRHVIVHEFGTLAGCRFDPALFGGCSAYGSPSGVQLVCEVGAFTLFLLVVGRFGPWSWPRRAWPSTSTAWRSCRFMASASPRRRWSGSGSVRAGPSWPRGGRGQPLCWRSVIWRRSRRFMFLRRFV